MNSKKHNSAHQREGFDDEVLPPPQDRIEERTSKRDGRGNAPPRLNDKTHQSEQRTGFFWDLFQKVIPVSYKPSLRTNDERKQRENGGTLLVREPQESDCEPDQSQGSPYRLEEWKQVKSILEEKERELIEREEDLRRQLHEAEQNMVKREQVLQAEIHEIQSAKSAPQKHLQFRDILKEKEREWIEREESLRRQLHEAKQNMVKREQVSQAKIHKIQLAKSALEEQHNAFIRKQQEASFKQMESAQWLPVDETKVISDLDRLKRDMRTWARTASIKDISVLQSLKTEEYSALMQELSNIVVLENDELPKSIFAIKKSPMLLLNALLAHHVHMTFSRSPFFFLRSSSEKSSSTESALEDIYQQAKNANPRDAHIWRSQTLRLLMPPLGLETSDGEIELNQTTEATITKVAQEEAVAFLNGPASSLVGKPPSSDVAEKLKKIYDEAARQLYKLWTRRAELKCYTLRDMDSLGFNPESEDFDPDNLVKYDDHEDQLKGKPVSVLVHPLLCVAGTDEGNDYDRERVWAKGVVWLDSKKE